MNKDDESERDLASVILCSECFHLQCSTHKTNKKRANGFNCDYCGSAHNDDASRRRTIIPYIHTCNTCIEDPHASRPAGAQTPTHHRRSNKPKYQ